VLDERSSEISAPKQNEICGSDDAGDVKTHCGIRGGNRQVRPEL